MNTMTPQEFFTGNPIYIEQYKIWGEKKSGYIIHISRTGPLRQAPVTSLDLSNITTDIEAFSYVSDVKQMIPYLALMGTK